VVTRLAGLIALRDSTPNEHERVAAELAILRVTRVARAYDLTEKIFVINLLV
jgi:hypothetical protein